MENLKTQTHSKEAFLLATSRMLERTSYYGLRSIIILHMVSETHKMDYMDAFSIYGIFTTAIIFSEIIGALLGDLVIGNRTTMITGGILQAIGAFSFCIPSTTGLYAGWILLVIGSGLYGPNILSNFGKTYLSKTKLLDAGFTIFYFAVNLGAFLGVLLIGLVGDKYGWNAGFITAGIIMLASVTLLLFSEEKKHSQSVKNALSMNRRVAHISIAVVCLGVFWAIYEIPSFRGAEIISELREISAWGIPKDLWTSMNVIFLLTTSILLIILWTKFYSSPFFKLMIGFILGTLSFAVLLLIPEIPTEEHTALYLISILFLAISEIHIAPIILSVLTQYSNPKYLAILISLAFLPTRLLSLMMGLFNGVIFREPEATLFVYLIVFAVLSVGLVLYNRSNNMALEAAKIEDF